VYKKLFREGNVVFLIQKYFWREFRFFDLKKIWRKFRFSDLKILLERVLSSTNPFIKNKKILSQISPRGIYD